MLKRRPTEEEFAPYYGGYISKVEGEDILSILETLKLKTAAFLESIPKDKWDFAYAEGKWTIKEVLLHIIDCERVFLYRALRIARGDSTTMPGFDQDLFNQNADAHNRTVDSLMAEYLTMRDSTIFFFKYLTDEAAERRGTASGVVFTPIGVAFTIAGHENHHIGILKERYL